MKENRFWAILMAVLVLGSVLLLPPPAVSAEEDSGAQAQEETRWENRAEKSLGLGPGLARQLMTEEEWREHHRKMQTMTSEEREQYRKEVHQQMVERAKEKGVEIPDKPRRTDGDRGGKGMGGGRGGGRGR